MDRLTEIYFDEFGIKHARLKDNIAKKTYRSYTWTPQEIANEKLAELEDFMEKHKCHSVGDLMLEFTISAVDKLNLKLTEEKLAEMKAKLTESESESNARYSAWQEEIGECDRLREQLAEKNEFLVATKWKVDDLEKQLAEKEKYIEEQEFAEYKEMFYATQELKEDCELKILELEKQLTNKEKEIEELNHKLNVEQPCLLMNYKDMVDMLKKSQNQTAIEALEKVKESLEDCYGYDYPHLYHFIQSKVDEKIDQQIKKLKGE